MTRPSGLSGIVCQQKARRDATLRAEQDAEAVERMTAELQINYLAEPGATEGAFKAALPALLEERRREATARRLDRTRLQIGANARRVI